MSVKSARHVGSVVVRLPNDGTQAGCMDLVAVRVITQLWRCRHMTQKGAGAPPITWENMVEPGWQPEVVWALRGNG